MVLPRSSFSTLVRAIAHSKVSVSLPMESSTKAPSVALMEKAWEDNTPWCMKAGQQTISSTLSFCKMVQLKSLILWTRLQIAAATCPLSPRSSNVYGMAKARFIWQTAEFSSVTSTLTRCLMAKCTKCKLIIHTHSTKSNSTGKKIREKERHQVTRYLLRRSK